MAKKVLPYSGPVIDKLSMKLIETYILAFIKDISTYTQTLMVKDFTLISNTCHQNIEGKIVIFVSLFRCSCKIRDYSSYELNYI